MDSRQTPPHSWREEYRIHSYEIGPSGYATPQAICRFLQETAINHVAQLALAPDDVMDKDQMWVLANMSLRIDNYPRWRDSLVVETWPVAHESAVRGYRDFTLTDVDGHHFGAASSLWLLLNSETRRPLKLSSRLMDIAGPALEPKFLHTVKESDYPDQPTFTQEFVIRGSDIDWNLHVNNVCYLEWALETIPALYRLENKLAALDLTFVAEAKYGDTVVLKCYPPPDDSGHFMHKVEDKESGKVLALLNMQWHSKEATSLYRSLRRQYQKAHVSQLFDV